MSKKPYSFFWNPNFVFQMHSNGSEWYQKPFERPFDKRSQNVSESSEKSLNGSHSFIIRICLNSEFRSSEKIL